MKRFLPLLASATLLAVPLVGLATPAQADHRIENDRNFVCTGTVNHTTFQGNVVIPDGASCTITNSTILGNVRTEGAPVMVRIINTDVRLNIHVRNVTGSVTIGDKDCLIDPEVGRNLMVSNSRNVAICEMSVGNNLVLRNNTGRIMVRDNVACDNIRVVDNDVLGLRVLRNEFVVNFTVARNQVENNSRVEDNTERTGTPAACKKAVRGAIG